MAFKKNLCRLSSRCGCLEMDLNKLEKVKSHEFPQRERQYPAPGVE